MPLITVVVVLIVAGVILRLINNYISMRTPLLLTALLVASGILLSACATSYRFIPAKFEQPGNSSVSTESQQNPAAGERSGSDAEKSMRSNSTTPAAEATEGTNYNRNIAQATGSQRSPGRRAVLADRPYRPAARDAGLSAKHESSGPSMSADEIEDKHTTASPAQVQAAPRSSGGVPKWFLVVCCIFLPPLAVALVYGISDKFWIDLLLTLCFWIPGVIYAMIQVL